MQRKLKFLLTSALIAVVCVCGHELWKISAQYDDEAQIKKELSQYRPEPPKPPGSTESNKDPSAPPIVPPDGTADLPGAPMEEATDQPAAPEVVVNQSVIDMRNDINGDIVGWLTIPNTHVDYPFVLAADNDFYLRRNIYKKQATAGSIFMDYRCAADFSGFNTIIYGHNMKNSGMFGDLRLFADPGFFASNVTGALFVKDNTYTLEIFAYMVVRADDKVIYNPSASRDEFFEYVKKNARRIREPASPGRVVTLSTCAYEYDGARIVLLATINP